MEDITNNLYSKQFNLLQMYMYLSAIFTQSDFNSEQVSVIHFAER